jgi:hypothetical protein
MIDYARPTSRSSGQAAELIVVEDASRLDNAADEEYPLIVRRKAPHNQRIEQTPFGRSSSAAVGNYDSKWRLGNGQGIY